MMNFSTKLFAYGALLTVISLPQANATNIFGDDGDDRIPNNNTTSNPSTPIKIKVKRNLDDGGDTDSNEENIPGTPVNLNPNTETPKAPRKKQAIRAAGDAAQANLAARLNNRYHNGIDEAEFDWTEE